MSTFARIAYAPNRSRIPIRTVNALAQLDYPSPTTTITTTTTTRSSSSSSSLPTSSSDNALTEDSIYSSQKVKDKDSEKQTCGRFARVIWLFGWVAYAMAKDPRARRKFDEDNDEDIYDNIV
jgi:hypothetical protein